MYLLQKGHSFLEIPDKIRLHMNSHKEPVLNSRLNFEALLLMAQLNRQANKNCSPSSSTNTKAKF